MVLDWNNQGVACIQAAQWNAAKKFFQQGLERLYQDLAVVPESAPGENKNDDDREEEEEEDLQYDTGKCPWDVQATPCSSVQQGGGGSSFSTTITNLVAPYGFRVYAKAWTLNLVSVGNQRTQDEENEQEEEKEVPLGLYKKVLTYILYNMALTLHGRALVVSARAVATTSTSTLLLLQQAMSLYEMSMGIAVEIRRRRQQQLQQQQQQARQQEPSSSSCASTAPDFSLLALLNNVAHIHAWRCHLSLAPSFTQDENVDENHNFATFHQAMLYERIRLSHNHYDDDVDDNNEENNNIENRFSPNVNPKKNATRADCHDDFTFFDANLAVSPYTVMTTNTRTCAPKQF